VSWHTLRYIIGMSTDGAMMPMVETNLETVRNPTNLFVGWCQLKSVDTPALSVERTTHERFIRAKPLCHIENSK